MIRLKKVRKEYKDFVLDCSLEVKKGYITGLVGANGAGKSTTFKAILGLLHLDGGKITVFGKEAGRLSEAEKAQIGVVLSGSGFSGCLNGKEILRIMENLYPTFQKEEFLQRCSQFELPMNKPLKEFSTGMKRKLQIAATLSISAKVLLLDEPTAGMDVATREGVKDMLREYMEKDEERAILISSHIATDLEGLCDEVYIIEKGEIALHEETDVLLGEYGILKVSAEQYEKLDKAYILKKKKEGFGYSLLTREKQFYQENYPDIVMEKAHIDEVLLMMIRGEVE